MSHIRQNYTSISQCAIRIRIAIAPAHFSPGPDQIIPFKGCLVWGFLRAPGEQLSSYSVQPLQRDYSLQTHSKVGMENLYNVFRKSLSLDDIAKSSI